MYAEVGWCSNTTQHANQFVHNINFDHFTIVDKACDYHKKLFPEALHSQRDRSAGNEHIEIPDIILLVTNAICCLVCQLFTTFVSLANTFCEPLEGSLLICVIQLMRAEDFQSKHLVRFFDKINVVLTFHSSKHQTLLGCICVHP